MCHQQGPCFAAIYWNSLVLGFFCWWPWGFFFSLSFLFQSLKWADTETAPYLHTAWPGQGWTEDKQLPSYLAKAGSQMQEATTSQAEMTLSSLCVFLLLFLTLKESISLSANRLQELGKRRKVKVARSFWSPPAFFSCCIREAQIIRLEVSEAGCSWRMDGRWK